MGELYLFYVTEHRLLIIKLLFIHLGLPQTAALFSGFNVDVLYTVHVHSSPHVNVDECTR